MGNNSRNNNRQNSGNQQRSTPTPTPAETPAPADAAPEDKVVEATPPVADTAETPGEETPKQQSSDETNGDQSESETAETSPEGQGTDPAPAEPAPVEVVEDERPEATEVKEDDSSTVADLKNMLAEFAKINTTLGQDPKDFRDSAFMTVQIMRHVVKFPTNDVLSALLDFFKAHKNDVCKGENFLKGSTNLSQQEEQKVGFLYNLFNSLANEERTRFAPSSIIAVLGKPEFVTFLQRRRAGFGVMD